MGRAKTAAVLAVMASCTAVLVAWDSPRMRIELILERPSIERAALEYLEAEMSGDHAKVYSMLAPSSAYVRSHTYGQYLEEASGSTVKVRGYRIVDIYRLRPNHDPNSFPGVERFVQVEVEVDVGFDDMETTTTCNYCFTFLKEKGRWYKG